MRLVPLLIVAALIGVVAAGGNAQTHNAKLLKRMKAVSSKAGKALSQTSKPLAMHMELGKRLLTSKHVFEAKQATSTGASSGTPVCDPVKYGEAQVKATQACPSLPGLITGSTTLEDFLPGFCGSECYNTLATELPANIGCLTSDTAILLALVQGCQTRPQCFSEAFIGVNARIQRECGDVSQVADFSNITTGAEANVARLCSGTCVSRMTSLMRQFPECIVDETGTALPGVAAIANLMDGACTQDGGKYCGAKLKAFGKIDCESDCYNPNNWCSSSCNLDVDTEDLTTLCSPCTDILVKNIGAAGDEADILVNGIGLLCSTATGGATSATNPFCYPLAMRAYGMFEASANWPQNSTMATMCSGMTPRCTDRVTSAAAAMTVATAQMDFVKCVQGYYYTSDASKVAYCLPDLEYELRKAESMRVTGNALCAQNAKGDFCMWRIGDLITDGCSSAAADVTDAGCCMPLWNDLARMYSTSYPATYLPSGSRSVTYKNWMTGNATTLTYTHTAKYSFEELDRSQEPANTLLACSIQNTSSYWDLVENDCPTTLVEPPKRQLPVTIAWARVSSDAALKQNVENALRVDTANAMGVPVRNVVNGTLMENKALTIQLRPDTRRASSGTGSGCTYVFFVDAASATEASAAAARLDSQVAAGTLVTPATSSTVQSQCTSCMDARSTNLAKASTSVDGTDGSSPSSSAVKASVFAAIVAALAVMVVF